MRRREFTIALGAAGAASMTDLARSQAPPPAAAARPVRWIVPFTVGGPVDLGARKLAEVLAPRMGEVIVIDNKPGASGGIGTADCVRAAPDGHTFALASSDSLIGASLLTKPPPYDPRKDLAFVTQFVAGPLVMLASTALRVNSVAELLDESRRRPQGVSYGSWGLGTLPQLIMSSIENGKPTNLIHIPYRGVAPALRELAAQQLDICFSSLAAATRYTQMGSAVPIAVTGPERAAALPAVATLAEQDHGGVLEASLSWVGLVGPKGLPRATVERWSGEIAAAIATAEFRSFMTLVMATPAGHGPARFAADLAREFDATNEMIRRLGIKLE